MNHMKAGAMTNELSIDEEDDISSQYTENSSIIEDDNLDIQSQRKNMSLTKNRALSISRHKDNEAILSMKYHQSKLYLQFNPRNKSNEQKGIKYSEFSKATHKKSSKNI